MLPRRGRRHRAKTTVGFLSDVHLFKRAAFVTCLRVGASLGPQYDGRIAYPSYSIDFPCEEAWGVLDVWGGHYATCDGTSRRSVLRVGMLGLAGLALPDLLRHRAWARDFGQPVKDTAVILVYLGGGLTHIDSYDPKPDAPSEFRGEFRTIATALPDVSLCEHFPHQARVLDKMAVLRSLHHTTADHNVGQHWVLTGYPGGEPLPSPATNDRPSAGSIAARLRGSNRPGLPPYVAIPRAPTFAHAAYLGPGFNPFSVAASPTQGVKVR